MIGEKPGSGARKAWAAMAETGAIGFEIAAAVGVSALAGWKLDQWLGTAPVLVVSLPLAGFAGSVYRLIRRQKGGKRP